MKKIISIVLVLSIFITLIPTKLFASETGYFRVTAYYSPLPNQKAYIKGNYAAEVRMNGQGIRWASWKRVFSGMLAAPGKYRFGTKIYLKGLWIWEVADRWGAIVQAWQRNFKHDRIDVWVGYGDEWLQRAMYWGNRVVKWHIVKYNSKVTLNYRNIPAPKWATSGLRKNKTPSLFWKWIGVWSSKTDVIELQKFLKKIWLYSGRIDWVYNSKTIETVYNFQIRNKLIKNSSTYWAWYWGWKTRNVVLRKYLNWEFKAKTTKIVTKKQINKKIVKNIFERKIENSIDVKKLEEILNKLGLYKKTPTWKYENIRNIILKYQLENKIISNKNQAWAGNFWPKTRKSIKEKYNTLLAENNRKKELEEKFQELKSLAKQEAENKIKTIWAPKYWETSEKVRELQKTLKKLGFLDYKDTAYFWNMTKKAIYDFQLSKRLVSKANDLWAWTIWPKTKNALKLDLETKILDIKLNNNKELITYLNKKNEPNKTLVENKNMKKAISIEIKDEEPKYMNNSKKIDPKEILESVYWEITNKTAI